MQFLLGVVAPVLIIAVAFVAGEFIAAATRNDDFDAIDEDLARSIDWFRDDEVAR